MVAGVTDARARGAAHGQHYPCQGSQRNATTGNRCNGTAVAQWSSHDAFDLVFDEVGNAPALV